MIDEEGRNCTVVADGRSDVAVLLCSEHASNTHLTLDMAGMKFGKYTCKWELCSTQ